MAAREEAGTRYLDMVLSLLAESARTMNSPWQKWLTFYRTKCRPYMPGILPLTRRLRILLPMPRRMHHQHPMPPAIVCRTRAGEPNTRRWVRMGVSSPLDSSSLIGRAGLSPFAAPATETAPGAMVETREVAVGSRHILFRMVGELLRETLKMFNCITRS